MRSLRRLLACAPVALVLFGGGVAAAATIRAQTFVGFSGLYFPGHWTPVRVTVENRGPEASGELSVFQDPGQRFSPVPMHVAARTVDLPPGSRKSFSFVLPLQVSVYPVRVTLVSGAETLLDERIDVSAGATTLPIAVVLSRTPSYDFLSAPEGGRSRNVVYPHPELLPDHWAAYGGVEVIVVAGAALRSMSDASAEAIGRWVESGGKLIFVGDTDGAPAPLQRLMPAAPLGGEPMEVSAPVDFAALTDVRDPLPGPTEVIPARALGSEVLVSADGLPLVARSRVGRGSVWFLAFDPAAETVRRWAGAAAFWSVLLAPGRRLEPALERASPERAEPAASLLALPLLAAPPRLPALGLLALYVGLLAAAQRAVGRRRLRGERARPWTAAGLLILPVALAASSLLVYRGWVEKPGALLLEVATIRGDGGSPALRTEDVVVTAARPVKVRLRSSAALVIGSDGKDLTVGDGGEVGPLVMRAWESRSFYLQSLGPAPATVVRESDGSVLVRSGDRPLEDALLLDASGAYRLGSLGAGESRRIELGSGALPLSEAEPADDLRRVVLDSLAAEPGPHLRLVGWIEGPVHRVQVSIGLAKVRRVSCVVVETGG